MERHEFIRQESVKAKRFDALHVVALLCLAGVIAVQAVVLVRVFRQHRSRRMLVEASDLVTATVPVENGTISPPMATATNAVANATTNVVSGAAAPVLNPSVKVQQASRRDEARAVNLQLRLRAQTGEPRFDPRLASVCVRWESVSGAVTEQWLAVPVRWENFAAQTLTARFAGTPGQLRAWEVRTFYRGQLQESVSSKPVL